MDLGGIMMKIDTNEIEHDFTIKEIDGFKLNMEV